MWPGDELHNLSGSSCSPALAKNDMLCIPFGNRGCAGATQALSTSPFSIVRVLWRWTGDDGGRCKVILGASSHGPAHRSSRQVGRWLLTEARARFGSHIDDRTALFKYALLPYVEGPRKDGLNKIRLIQSSIRS